MRPKVKKEENHAKEQAIAQMESIREMVEALHAEDERGRPDEEKREEAQQTIQEDALSVEVRSGWVTPGSDEMKAEEFCILLCTGGPAVRLRGELDDHGTPRRVWMEYQDWGTPWTQFFPECSEDTGRMLTYAQQFYFGE